MPDQSEPARKGAHTPGPWQYGVEGADQPIEIWHGDGVRTARFVCEVPQGRNGDGRANARLIAEAPAMEEDVLRKLVGAQETAVSTTEFGIMASDLADAARAILARIDGEGGE